MEFPSGILQVCGDSFAGQAVGFGGWWSPVALHVDTDSINDPTGVRYGGVMGVDKPLLADPTAAGDLAAALRAWCRSTGRTTCWSPPPAT